ncbi:MAG: tetratricopeptide repeat protein, partial [Pseudomonadota bacterium]|nr:tetratricopeptide repeat protein [Pseudomonadota bacterium]
MKPARILPALLLGAGLAHATAAASAPSDGNPFGIEASGKAPFGLLPPVPDKTLPVRVAQAGDAAFRMQQLEEQVRVLNGRVEELNFQLLQMQEQIRKMQEDNEFRFQELESRRGGPRPGNTETARRRAQEPTSLGKSRPSEQTTGAQRSDGDQIARVLEGGDPVPANRDVETIDGVEIYRGDGETGLPDAEGGLQTQTLGRLVFDAQGNVIDTRIDKPIDLTGRAGGAPVADTGSGDEFAALSLPDNPDELYDLGYSYFQAGEYGLAEEAFEEFSSRHGDHPKIAEARFWFGESLLSRGLYEDAAKVFLDAHKKYPSSRMGPQT